MTGTSADTPLAIPVPGFMRGAGAGSPMLDLDVIQPRILKSDGTADTSLYSNDDPPERQPRPGTLTRVLVFDLSNKEDLKQYEEELNKIGTCRFYVIRYTERHWDDTTRNWKVLLEVCERIRVAPEEQYK